MIRLVSVPGLLLALGWLPAGSLASPVAGAAGGELCVAGSRAQGELEAAALAFARLWEAGKSAEIGEVLEPAGIRFHLEDQAHASLPTRQAVAALKGFLSRHRSLDVGVTRVSEAGGDPPRGFAELVWDAVASGTSEPIRYVVYLGFVRDGGDWRVSEVRVMR